jgi:nitronate monooxygenase
LHALDPETAPVLYGQSARFVRAIRPAAEVVATVREEAERILRTRPAALLD